MVSFFIHLSKKLLFIFIIFSLTSCVNSAPTVQKNLVNFDEISFSVVQKKLVFNKDLPEYPNSLLRSWFDNKIKVNGFDGSMELTITDYDEFITNISDGKKIEIFMKFKIHIVNSNAKSNSFIEGEVTSYGTLSGNFSLKDFDKVIENTQSDVILRLSRDLSSKI